MKEKDGFVHFSIKKDIKPRLIELSAIIMSMPDGEIKKETAKLCAKTILMSGGINQGFAALDEATY